jgi:hypothetical protein
MQSRRSAAFLLGGEISVNRIAFGAMRLPTNGFRGPSRDPATGRAVLRRAVELGVTLIDTADFYRSGDGTVRANTLIHEALSPYPSDLVIATKVGPVFLPDGSFTHGKGADMRKLVEENLQSLGLDCLDLVYLRIGLMEVPHGESLAERFEALAALCEEGLIRHLGISNRYRPSRGSTLDCPGGGRSEQFPHCTAERPGAAEGLRGQQYRVQSVFPAGRRDHDDRRRPPRASGKSPWRDRKPDRFSMATGAVAGHDRDPWNWIGRSSGRECRRWRRGSDGRRSDRACLMAYLSANPASLETAILGGEASDYLAIAKNREAPKPFRFDQNRTDPARLRPSPGQLRMRARPGPTAPAGSCRII